jgi:hypothetical protein
LKLGFEFIYQVAVVVETPGLFVSLSASKTALGEQAAPI